MDIHIMQYYLAIVREGTISAAADALHVSQPALSRQIRALEEELGVELFERGNRKITLTEEGMVLRKRAEEMVRLLELTENEISQVRDNIAGEIHIGAGESHAFHFLSRAMSHLHEDYPKIRLNIVSGDTTDLVEQLNNGLLDFALVFSDIDRSLYHSIALPVDDHFGILMRKASPLAAKETVTVNDLYHQPLIISRAYSNTFFSAVDMSRINIVATYNLIYNASLLVEDGMGYAFTFDKLINFNEDSPLTFRPLIPEFKSTGTLIWKKYEVHTPAAQLFLSQLQRDLAANKNDNDKIAYRESIRKKGISSRDSLDANTRKELSSRIVERIACSQEFINAKTIMLYKAVRGEVNLQALEPIAAAAGKKLVYPLCINKTEMIAFSPNSNDAWRPGSFGIMEPVKDKSTMVMPEDIDLVICPCTVFDENCNRMGMGAGYYDRFLLKCTNAHVVSVAFEAQKNASVPVDSRDKPMEKVFSDAAVYTR